MVNYRRDELIPKVLSQLIKTYYKVRNIWFSNFYFSPIRSS